MSDTTPVVLYLSLQLFYLRLFCWPLSFPQLLTVTAFQVLVPGLQPRNLGIILGYLFFLTSHTTFFTQSPLGSI